MKKIPLKRPVYKIPRQGWNYTVDGYEFKRDSEKELVAAVTEYLVSVGKPTDTVQADIEDHIARLNPWMGVWTDAIADLPAPKPMEKRTVRQWNEVLKGTPFVSNEQFRKRIDICRVCPSHSRNDKPLSVGERWIIAKKNDPTIGCCNAHGFDCVVAASRKYEFDVDKSGYTCWAEPQKE